jgi:hypothetical protein
VTVLLRDAGGAAAADSLRAASLEACRAELLRTHSALDSDAEEEQEEVEGSAWCEDGGDGALRIRYTATAAGVYALSVYLDDEAVGSSPYRGLVVAPAEPSPLTTGARFVGEGFVAGVQSQLVRTLATYTDGKVANRNGRAFGWEIAHAAVSRRPPISLHTFVARTEGYTCDAGDWDLSIVQ